MLLDGNLTEDNNPEFIERVKSHLRNIGVEILPDMKSPVAPLEEGETVRTIHAVSRISDTLSEDAMREFILTQKYTRAALYQVTERKFFITHVVDPVTFESTKLEEPHLSVKYIIRAYFE